MAPRPEYENDFKMEILKPVTLDVKKQAYLLKAIDQHHLNTGDDISDLANQYGVMYFIAKADTKFPTDALLKTKISEIGNYVASTPFSSEPNLIAIENVGTSAYSGTVEEFLSRSKSKRVPDIITEDYIDDLFERSLRETVEYKIDQPLCDSTDHIQDLGGFSNPLSETSCKDAPGIGIPYLILGGHSTMSSLHAEDSYLSSLNVSYYGQKIWLIIHPKDIKRLKRKIRKHIDDDYKHKFCFLRTKTYTIPPKLLRKWKIRFVVIVQKPGEFIVANPGIYHCVINAVSCINAAVNFVPLSKLHRIPIENYQPCNCPWTDKDKVQWRKDNSKTTDYNIPKEQRRHGIDITKRLKNLDLAVMRWKSNAYDNLLIKDFKCNTPYLNKTTEVDFALQLVEPSPTSLPHPRKSCSLITSTKQIRQQNIEPHSSINIKNITEVQVQKTEAQKNQRKKCKVATVCITRFTFPVLLTDFQDFKNDRGKDRKLFQKLILQKYFNKNNCPAAFNACKIAVENIKNLKLREGECNTKAYCKCSAEHECGYRFLFDFHEEAEKAILNLKVSQTIPLEPSNDN